LIRHHAKTIHFFVPLGLKKWLQQLCSGLENKIVELDWFQEVSILVELNLTVTEKEMGSSETLVGGAQATASASRIKVACTPAQHRSGRGLFDQHTSLWCTWMIGVLAAESYAVAETDDDRWTYGLPKEGFRCFFGGFVDSTYRGLQQRYRFALRRRYCATVRRMPCLSK
jgi:N-acyl-phosphatidylethanolamine-hydrolysing phospholipase D